MALLALGAYTDHTGTRAEVLIAALRDESHEIRKTAAMAICSLAQHIGTTSRYRPETLDPEHQRATTVLREALKELVCDDELNNPPFTERALNWIASIADSRT
jgi:hypothetical protein